MTTHLLYLLLAVQGPPVYQDTTIRAEGTTCSGPRVTINSTTGEVFCCVSSLWVRCSLDRTKVVVTQQPALDTSTFALSSLGTGLLLNVSGGGISGVKSANTCTNQFPRSDTTSAVWTCASIATADLPTVVTTKGGTGLTTSTPGAVYVGAVTDTTAMSAAGTNTLQVLHSGIAGVPTWSYIHANSLSATGAKSALVVLTGDNTWSQPFVPAAQANILGTVKGTGTALVCTGTDKVTGFDANGVLQCASDQTSAGGTIVWDEIPSGLINSSNQTYTLANTPTAGTLTLYWNGVRQRYTSDFSLATATITTVFTAQTGDWLYATYSY